MRSHEAGVLHAPGYGGAHLSPDADGRHGVHARALGTQRPPSGRWRPGGGRSRRAHTPAELRHRGIRARRRRLPFSCKGFQAGYAAAFADACGGADVYYAGKAFLCTAVARWVMEEGLFLDVCSGGELAVAQRVGFPGADPDSTATTSRSPSCVPHSPMAWDASSSTRLTRSTGSSPSWGTRCRRARHDPRDGRRRGPHARVHRDRSRTRSSALRSPAAWPSGRARGVGPPDRLRLLGLHSHIGSQIFDTAGFEASASRLIGLHARIAEELGHNAPEIDLGGGYGIATPANTRPDAGAARRADESSSRPSSSGSRRRSRRCSAAGVDRARSRHRRAGSLHPLRGGHCQAGRRRRWPGRTYVSVDGGMSDNPRPALYEADYSATLANRSSEAPPVVVRVVGSIASGDIVVLDGGSPAMSARAT